MVRFRTSLLAAVAAICCGPSVASDHKVTDVDGIAAILTGLGHSVVENLDDDGPNLVVDGGRWAVLMLDCEARLGCREAYAYARRKLDARVHATCANDFNAMQSRGAAWLDDLNQPWYRSTINLEGDPGVASVTSSLGWFQTLLAEFEAHIATCPPIRKDL